mmetsp:Transcript_30092/g.53350  ORF Transcript_30092/g.53350 Transcript_30092/m.53350 type:complete len:287 (+) Transcript_30092:40-900(+)
MEITSEVETDRLPSDARLFTEYSFEVNEHRHNVLKMYVDMWRYYSLAISFTFILLIIAVATDSIPDIALLPLYAFDLGYWYVLHRRLLGTEFPPERQQIQKELVCNCLMLTFKAIIPARLIGCPAVILIVPLACEVLLRFSWRHVDRLECQTFLIVSKAVFLGVKFFTILNITIKLDKIVYWNWTTVFWPIWLSVLIVGLAAIAFVFLFAGTVFSWLLRESTGREVIVSAWILICAMSMGLCFGAFFLSLSDMLDNDYYTEAPFSIPLVFTGFFFGSLAFIGESLV